MCWVGLQMSCLGGDDDYDYDYHNDSGEEEEEEHDVPTGRKQKPDANPGHVMPYSNENPLPVARRPSVCSKIRNHPHTSC